jgi:pimeloyl-ACP methyl ester carboxylesterase
MHYETAGAGKAVLVLVHGNFASWRWWRSVLKRLPAGYCAYAPDLRGCGDTGRPPDGHTIHQLTEDLHQFVKALKLPRFHLVGHSLGGAVALEFALNHPKRLKTLILVAPAPPEGMPLLQNGNQNACWMPSLDTVDATYRFFGKIGVNRPMLRRALKKMAPTMTRDHLFEALVDDAGRMSSEAMAGHLETLDSWNVVAQLEELLLPVLILWGKRDTLIPRASMERTAQDLSRGRLIVLPRVGHAPQLEHPERFLRLLVTFIGQNSPGPWPDLWKPLRRLRQGIVRAPYSERFAAEWLSSIG